MPSDQEAADAVEAVLRGEKQCDACFEYVKDFAWAHNRLCFPCRSAWYLSVIEPFSVWLADRREACLTKKRLTK
jgi:hypothetical protein